MTIPQTLLKDDLYVANTTKTDAGAAALPCTLCIRLRTIDVFFGAYHHLIENKNTEISFKSGLYDLVKSYEF